jgi:hypothetical protein
MTPQVRTSPGSSKHSRESAVRPNDLEWDSDVVFLKFIM